MPYAMEPDLDHWFSFEIGTPRDIGAETPEGGLRFPVRSALSS